MQNGGVAYTLIPAIKKLYSKKEDRAAALKRHLEFFNTHPFMANPIFGVTMALEEERANSADVDDAAMMFHKIKNKSGPRIFPETANEAPRESKIGLKEAFSQYAAGRSIDATKVTTLQDNLNQLVPGLAALGLTFLCMYLLKKKVSPIIIILPHHGRTPSHLLQKATRKIICDRNSRFIAKLLGIPMVKSLNTIRELTDKGTWYRNGPFYGNVMVGDYAFEFYNETKLQDYIYRHLFVV